MLWEDVKRTRNKCFKIFMYAQRIVIVFICVHLYMNVSVVPGKQMSALLELEVQIVSCPVCVLETELKSSARAVQILNCHLSSPSLYVYVTKLFTIQKQQTTRMFRKYMIARCGGICL